MKSNSALYFLFIAVFVTVNSVQAGSGDMPVFRYALERWEPDAYELMIFYDGKNPSSVTAALAALARATNNVPANLVVTMIDTGDDEGAAAFPEGTPRPPIPGAVLSYPPKYQPGNAAWEGVVTVEKFSSLVDSPARRELVRRLSAGDKPVWLLIESGTEEGDESAVRELKMANIDPIRIRRTDPAEQVFLSILIHSKSNLDQYADQPLVFPCFGRGRVLHAIAGAGINAVNLAAADQFLTDPCSSEVKDNTPGTDVLLAADWGKILHNLPDLPPISTSTVAKIVEPSAIKHVVHSQQLEHIALRPKVETNPAAPGALGSRRLSYALTIFAGIGLLIIAIIVRNQRARRRLDHAMPANCNDRKRQ